MNASKLFEMELRIRSRLTGGLQGLKKDVTGLAFEELREYIPGDPLRSVHQGASFRVGREMVAMRIPDRKVEIVCIVDTTPSMYFGGTRAKKFDVAKGLFVVGAEVAREHQARFSLRYRASLDTRAYLAEYPIRSSSPKVVAKQFSQFVGSLSHVETDTTFDLAKAFESLVRRGKQQTLLVVVVSDFLFEANYADVLARLVAEKHTVVGVAILDSAEIALPQLSCGALRVRDSETGVSALIARSPEHYLEAHKQLWANARASFEVMQPEGGSS